MNCKKDKRKIDDFFFIKETFFLNQSIIKMKIKGKKNNLEQLDFEQIN